MNIDITKCKKTNITDSCSLWNILSSLLVYSVIVDNNFLFSITKFVEYECLYKPRANPNVRDNELQVKLKTEVRSGRISCHQLTVEDLQDEDILKYRDRIGIGELSSIAFAKKVSIPFLTDDQRARKVGCTILGTENVQTSPLIIGWLFYTGLLADNEIESVINSQVEYNRPLTKYYREVHSLALKLKYLYKI